MKRILILTILLMSSLAWAGSTTVVVGQGGGGEASALYTAATVILDFENNANDTKGSKNFTGQNTPAYSNTDYKQGSYSADLDDATAQYFSRADDNAFDTGMEVDWSMSFWVKYDDITNAGSIYGKYDGGSGKGLWIEAYYISGADYGLRINTMNAWTNVVIDTAQKLANGTWYHIAISYDASATNECTVWISAATFGSVINGTAFNSDTDPGGTATAIIVGGYDTSHTLDGHLDEFVFWNGTAITATDAQNIYNGNWR